MVFSVEKEKLATVGFSWEIQLSDDKSKFRLAWRGLDFDLQSHLHMRECKNEG